jgi:hypothetical protein
MRLTVLIKASGLPHEGRIETFDPWDEHEVARKNLKFIAQHVKYLPHKLLKNKAFSDGLADYTLLSVQGDTILPDVTYVSDNSKFLPVKILACHKILWMRFYTCNIGYYGEEDTRIKSRTAILNHLRGNRIRSMLP